MQIVSESVADTIRIGAKIAKYLHRGDILCLFGDLGSGKTVFAKGLALGLGAKKHKVISPSFVLLCRYTDGRIPLYHFDFYRLKSALDILGLGYEDYLYADGVSVIEWPQRLDYLLPEKYLQVEFLIKSDTKRRIKFSGVGINLPAAAFPHPLHRG